MRKLAAALLLVLAGVAMAAPPALAANLGGLFNPAPAAAAAASPVAVSSKLIAVRPLLAAELADDFPNEFAALSASFAIIYAGPDATQNAVAGGRAIADLGARFVTQIHQAPAADLLGLVKQMRGLHALVLKQAGPKICGGFSSGGSGVLYAAGIAGQYMGALDALSAAFFKAVAHAKAHPTTTLVPVDADWKLAAQRIMADGGKQSFIDVIAKGDSKDPEICPAMVALLQAVTELQGDAGLRLRAAFAVNAAAY